MTTEAPRTPGKWRPADLAVLAAAVACVVLLAAVAWRGAHGPEGGPGFRDPFTRPNVTPISREDVIARSLSLHEARYWRKREGNEVLCELCPTLCLLRDGERGQCRVRVNYGGTLYALTYGKLVAEHVDPIEKKPLHHFLPATGVYSIATAGCNLSCVFCQNWQISQAYPEKEPFVDILPAEAVQRALAVHTPSIAYTYTEPSVFYEYMFDCAQLAHEKGLLNVWVTCGYLNEEPLRAFAPYLDAANVDLKSFDEAFYQEWCGAHLAPVLRTIEVLAELNVHVEITNLLVPGGNDAPETIRAMCRWLVKSVGPQVPLHFTRYHPDYKLERPGPTPLATMLKARDIAREEGLKYVYIGNVAAPDGQITACASCGRTLIDRQGYFIRVNEVREGKCPSCGALIPGVWESLEHATVRVPVTERRR